MGRIEDRFNELKKRNEKALIAFISAGDPDIETTKDLVLEMDKRGADIIELGVPFSDPLADGPTIQKSYLRALKKRVSLKKILKMVKEMRQKTDCPLVLMSSYNPVYRYGENKFVRDAVSAGVDGVIIPDMPPEESGYLWARSYRKWLDTIFLLAPTSNDERIKLICKMSRGFIYYVSVTGITGERKLLSKDIEGMIKKIRQSTDLPLAVGFGISTPQQAKEIASCADGIIVGSAIVRIIEKHALSKNGLIGDVGDFIKSLKNAIRHE
ncbi:MAG: tryptophan synthase subunit alpha [Nitrospinae bacterium]|nr:tryptophan synthase subunit alpha [Nitrospinota bacterium]